MESGLFAVLTGDLVNSSRLNPAELKETRHALLGAVGHVKRWKKGLVLSKAEFFRGDSWQMLLAEPAYALRTALFLRARLKGLKLSDTRIGIGIGTVDDISAKRVSLSSGAAFAMSGRALDGMSLHFRMSITVAEPWQELERWLPVVVGLCDSLAGQWKPRQSEIISWALSPGNLLHEEIAERLELPVTKQAVAKSLKGASWYSLKAAVDEFERSRWKNWPKIEQPNKVDFQKTT